MMFNKGRSLSAKKNPSSFKQGSHPSPRGESERAEGDTEVVTSTSVKGKNDLDLMAQLWLRNKLVGTCGDQYSVGERSQKYDFPCFHDRLVKCFLTM